MLHLLKKKGTLFLLFLMILIYPIIGGHLDNAIKLSGVVEKKMIPQVDIHGLLDGELQQSFGDWWQENFPGRVALIKIRNQLMYSILGTSPNNNVVIGKDKYLFEQGYIDRYLGLTPNMSEDDLNKLVRNLTELNALLEREGKKLYVFITPSKARFYKDKLPLIYDGYIHENNGQEYEAFRNKLQQAEIHYFDSIEYLNTHKGMFDAPYFYASGVHWEHTWGNQAALELLNLIEQTSQYDLSELRVNSTETTEQIWPNADLYDSMNLMMPSDERYYKSTFELQEEGKDKPSVFLRGGSFMGQSLNALINAGVFGQNAHYENNYYFMDNYSRTAMLSSFTAYDELDEMIKAYLRNSDILILEVNEAAIPNMSFGFIEYLLQNQELLVRG